MLQRSSEHLLWAGAVGLLATTFGATGAEAQQTQSRLYEVTKSKKLRVCQFPLYYSTSFRNSKTGEIEGIDADLAKEFAKELDAKLEITEVELRHVHRRPAGRQARDRHVRRRRHHEARTGRRILQALPADQPLCGHAQGRQDQEVGRHRQEGRQGRGVDGQLHGALHEGLPKERRHGFGGAAQHA